MANQETYLQVLAPEELADAIRSAQLEVCQLSRTPAASRLARVACTSSCLDFSELGPAFLFSGVMPRDCYTLVYVTDCPEPGHSFNFSTKHLDGYMGFFPPGGEVDAYTPPGYASATLTVSAPAFLRAIGLAFPEIPDRFLNQGCSMRIGHGEQSRLGFLLSKVLGSIENPKGSFVDLSSRGELERLLIATFLDTLRNGVGNLTPPPKIRVAKRFKRLRQARDFIREHAGEPIQLGDLSSELGLSARGVEVLFRESVGIGPSAFIRHQRLHGVRRELLESRSSPGAVKEAALKWGFWHMGHFSRSYGGLFGEKPAATLSRHPVR